jgi:N-acetylmuramoyl-L-alanine amidase
VKLGRRTSGPALAAALVVSLATLAGCGVPGSPGTATVVPPVAVSPDATSPAATSPAVASPSVASSGPTASGSTAASSTATSTSGTSTKTPTGTTTKTTAGVPVGSPLAGMVLAAGASGQPSKGGATLAPTASGPLSGRTILVDPGHNGKLVGSIVNAQVPAGHGTTKVCNSSGTESLDKTSEHATNWAVGVRLVGLLRAQGATVLLSRPSDSGVGPCVNERAAMANRNKVDLVLSIHGDGAEGAGQRGFHVIVSSSMDGGSALQTRSASIAKTLVGELESRTPLPRSTYVGGGTGVDSRDDIAGLNLLTGPPGVMLEMGNLRNASDWAYLKTDAAKDALAAALASTAVKTLG